MNTYRNLKILLLVLVLLGNRGFAATSQDDVTADVKFACGAGGSISAAHAGERCLYRRTDFYDDTNPYCMFSWVRLPYTIAQLSAWKNAEDTVPEDERDHLITHPGSSLTRTSWGGTYPVIQRFQHDALEYVTQLSASLPADGMVKIMDLGCGNGFMSRGFSFIAKTEFLLVDIFKDCIGKAVPKYIELSRNFGKRGKIAHETGDWGVMDVTKYKNSVDLVWASQCLHFMGSNTPRAFANIRDCLKPGGVLMGIVQVPSLGLATVELLEESLKPGYVPGVIGLKADFIDNVPYYKPFPIKAEELAGKPIGFMYNFYNNVTFAEGRRVAKDGFTQVNQFYNEALLRRLLGAVGLDVVDLYHVSQYDVIVAADDKTATHICFVARKDRGV